MATGKFGWVPDRKEKPQGAIGSASWFVTRMFVIALCVTTVLTLFAREHWCADLLANLRMQQLIGSNRFRLG